MKMKRFALVICLVSAIVFSCFPNSYREVSAKTALVKGYNDFYKVMSSGIVGKLTAINMNVTGYNSNTYNEYKAINSIMKNYKKLNYIVSSIKLVKQRSGNDTNLRYSFGYTTCNYIAENQESFYKAIQKAVSENRTSFKIKIIDYTKSYSLTNFNSHVLKNALGDQVHGAAQIYRTNNLDSVVYAVTLSGKSTILSEDKIPAGPVELPTVTEAPKDIVQNDQQRLVEESDIQSIVQQAIICGQPSVEFMYITGKGLTFEKINKIVDKTIEDNSEYCYFSSWNKALKASGDLGTYKVTFKLTYTKDKLDEIELAITKKIEQILSRTITADMDDYGKELALHNYLVKSVQYDYDNYIKRSLPADSYLAYGALIKGTAVCDGYSKAFKRLLNAAGIESRLISGETLKPNKEAHIWNLVKLENEYYHVDVTYNDPIVKGDKSGNGTLRYTYFNLTDSEMKKDHLWDVEKYPTCSSKNFAYNVNRKNSKN